MSVKDIKTLLGLPINYKVDACIVYGGYKSENKKIFLSVLRKFYQYKIEKLNDEFLNPILSVKAGGKRIWFIIEYGGVKLSEIIHFASMFGSKVNVLTGTIGALKKGLDPLGIIIPTYSYSIESSSHMYLRNNKNFKFYPDKKLIKIVAKLLKEKNKIYICPTMTCQAMMAETWEDITKWSQKGFYGVEMEASTIFAVSKHFNVPSVAILNIADNLIEKETVASKSYEKRKDLRKKIKREIFKASLELIFQKVK